MIQFKTREQRLEERVNNQKLVTLRSNLLEDIRLINIRSLALNCKKLKDLPIEFREKRLILEQQLEDNGYILDVSDLKRCMYYLHEDVIRIANKKTLGETSND
jgi:hypothetical protein